VRGYGADAPADSSKLKGQRLKDKDWEGRRVRSWEAGKMRRKEDKKLRS
jgi:hypothetical protein